MIPCSFLDHCPDQLLRYSTETKSTNEERIARLNVLDGLLGTRENLLAEAAESCLALRLPSLLQESAKHFYFVLKKDIT